MSILLKGCPRCGGDLFLPRKDSRDDPNCIQCGFEGNANAISRVKRIKENKVVNDQYGSEDSSVVQA